MNRYVKSSPTLKVANRVNLRIDLDAGNLDGFTRKLTIGESMAMSHRAWNGMQHANQTTGGVFLLDTGIKKSAWLGFVTHCAIALKSGALYHSSLVFILIRPLLDNLL